MGCYSACAYMFFGGKIRQADGVLAVHQSGYYGTDADKSKRKVSEVQQNTQFTVSEIIGFLNEFETPPWVYQKMFRSLDFYVFDESEKKRLALRTDEINAQTLYAINGFIKIFFEYLENLDEKTQKPDETETPELSEEEELRLVVTEIQKLLNAAGCNAGVADGIWGRRTEAAAVLFAKTAKLPHARDELISEEFLTKLREAPAKFCPIRKLKRTFPNVISGYWLLKASCPRNNIVGTVVLSLNKRRSGVHVYEVDYRNSLNQIGSGSAFFYADDRLEVKMKIWDDGRYIEPSTIAKLTLSGKTFRGSDTNGCKLTATKQ